MVYYHCVYEHQTKYFTEHFPSAGLPGVKGQMVTSRSHYDAIIII